jgi:hypothetical protein
VLISVRTIYHAITVIAMVIWILAIVFVPADSLAGGLDFLLPGISLRSVEFDSGSSVKYMVISESYGIPDTSMVELSILEAAGGYALIEVSTSPYPRILEETVRVRMWLSEGVRWIESPKEFSSHASEILVKEGDGPFQAPSPEDLEELELERMFLSSPEDSMSVSLGREEVDTPAGPFPCEKKEIVKLEENEVSLGGVEAVRVERERTILWLSTDIPFWGLVRSRIERESSTVLADDSGFQQEPRRSVTESVLISFSKSSD